MPVGAEGTRRDTRASVRSRSRSGRTGLDRKVRAGTGKAHRCASSSSYAGTTRRCTDGSAQLLQTHVHAMQSIQDQQNTLIGAVLPLVPILHGVPPQIDQIKGALSDMVADAVSAMTTSVENVRSTLVAEFAHGHGRAGSLTRVGSSSISGSRRRQSNASVFGPQDFNVSVSSPLESRGYGGPLPNFKRARAEGATCHAGNAHLPRKWSRLTVPLRNSAGPPVARTPRTPRRPLADLLFPPGSNTPGIGHHMAIHVGSTSRGYMRHLETLPAAGGPSNIPTPISRPALQPLEHARLDLQSPTITRRRSIVLHDMPFAVDKTAVGLPSAAEPSDQDTLSKAIKIEEILEPNLTGVFSIHSSPLSSPPSSMPRATRHDPNETSANMAQLSTQQHVRDDMPNVPLVELPPPSSDPFSSNPDESPHKSMSLRDRRAQISRVSCKCTQSSPWRFGMT